MRAGDRKQVYYKPWPKDDESTVFHVFPDANTCKVYSKSATLALYLARKKKKP